MLSVATSLESLAIELASQCVTGFAATKTGATTATALTPDDADAVGNDSKVAAGTVAGTGLTGAEAAGIIGTGVDVLLTVAGNVNNVFSVGMVFAATTGTTAGITILGSVVKGGVVTGATTDEAGLASAACFSCIAVNAACVSAISFCTCAYCCCNCACVGFTDVEVDVAGTVTAGAGAEGMVTVSGTAASVVLGIAFGSNCCA